MKNFTAATSLHFAQTNETTQSTTTQISYVRGENTTFFGSERHSSDWQLRCCLQGNLSDPVKAGKRTEGWFLLSSGWQGCCHRHKNWKHSASGRGDWHGNAFTGFFIIVSTAFYRPPCWSFYHISLGRRCPITISWSHCSLKEFWDDLLSHGAARSLSLTRYWGARPEGWGYCPP